tara:strand:+ start:8826 stop:9212 length:387 start_codon:yes stop_codon:yes gene_type:complete
MQGKKVQINRYSRAFLRWVSCFVYLFVFLQPVQANTYGFSNRHHVVTISNALKLQHESPVTVRGYIISSSGPEHYLIKDNTAKILTKIEGEVWKDLTVDSYTKVEVQGQIIREGKTVKIEADLVKISR